MTAKIEAPADVAAAPQNATVSENGIARLALRENPQGAPVRDDDWVMLHYTGWTTDGKMFDSSLVSGKPAIFPLDSLIPGMREALATCRTGEKVRVWIPQEMAYQGMPGMPAGTLVFEFDVLDIVTPQTPPLTPTPDAVKLGDGLCYQILRHGNGGEITERDTVSLDFVCWQDNGTRIHSSIEAGEQLVAPVRSLFEGLRRTLVHMREGDTFIAWVPQKMGIFPNGDPISGSLVFNVSITGLRHGPAALDAPPDVAAPPGDAQITPSGLATKILSPGAGTKHPAATSRVRVDYTGWTTDGAMFDSSVERGTPLEFNLNQVIPGWTEGLQLMVEGEERRLWIPENLAYRGMPSAPAGMLVFDVKLIAIV